MLHFKRHLYGTVVMSLLVPFYAAHSHNVDYNSHVVIGGEINEYNIDYNIQKAKLLDNYVVSLEKEMQNFKAEHYIKSEGLDSRAFDLRVMSTTLKKIQTIQIEKHHAESIIEGIIERLKSIKIEIRAILKTKLKDSMIILDILKEKRTISASRISKRFITFVNTFTPKVRKLSNSEKKKLILASLTNINIEASKLALFGSREYSSQKLLESSYSNSIRAIKRELETIKALIVN